MYFRSGIAGPKGRSIFNCLRCRCSAFHDGFSSPNLHQQCRSIPLSPHPCQHLCFDLLMIAILISVRWYLIVVLICICLMISDVEHVVIGLLAICMSSLEKCLFKSIAHFKLDCFRGFLVLSFVSSLYIWDINPLTNMCRKMKLDRLLTPHKNKFKIG